MGKLHTWAVTIAVVVVGLSPGLAIFSASSIARLLHRALWPRPEDAEEPGPEPGREEPAGVSASKGIGGLPTLSLIPRASGPCAFRDGFLTAPEYHVA